MSAKINLFDKFFNPEKYNKQLDQEITTSANTNQVINFNANSDLLLIEDKRFYVYVYCDPRKPGIYEYEGIDFVFLYEPFYVGKGYGNRYLNHLKQAEKEKTKDKNKLKLNKIRKILKLSLKPIIIKIKNNIIDKKSLQLEKLLINKIGRIDLGKGSLTNLSDGGEGLSGKIFPEDRGKNISNSKKGKPSPLKGKKLEERVGIERAKQIKIVMSEVKKGKKSPNKGKKLEEIVGEEKAKIIKRNSSEVKKGKMIGDKNPMYGVSRKQRFINKYGKELGEIKYEEYKRRIYDDMNTKGENNGMYGTNLYEVWIKKYGKEIADELEKQRKEKIRKSNSGKEFSSERKNNISKSKTGNFDIKVNREYVKNHQNCILIKNFGIILKNEKELIDLYTIKHFSLRRLTKYYNVKTNVIKNTLKYYNIKSRGRGNIYV